jgi:hypothetical protein
VILANLTTHGRENLRWLYHWLDNNALTVPKVTLLARYQRIRELTGDQATVETLLRTLEQEASDPQIRAIDVLVNLHGSPRQLWFAEGAISTQRLADRIADLQIEEKLRLLYSTACYGALHASDFVRAGFRVASGAIGVNANGAHDYPTQLLYWGLGAPYARALAAGNNRLITRAFDELARQADFEDVNSIKLAVGWGATTIGSSAA